MTAPALADFAGLWRVARDITDHRAGLTGRFTGTAILTPGGPGLRYREEGSLAFGAAAPVRAERSYLWSERGGRIAVCFADGRPFHDFDPADAAALHFCAPDHYAVRYDFARWPDWGAEWRVTGPRKDYIMLTRYCR